MPIFINQLCIIHVKIGKLILANRMIMCKKEHLEKMFYYFELGVEKLRVLNFTPPKETNKLIYKDIKDFIEYLDKEKEFFNNVEEINKYNIGAIAELIQYYNIKHYKHPIYNKNDIKKEVEEYFWSSKNSF